jgi:hypothetical protein
MIDYVLTSPPYWDMLHVQGRVQKNGVKLPIDLLFLIKRPEFQGLR